jgi:putative heme-binding domain-containing protein
LPNGVKRQVNQTDIKSMKQLNISLMPEGLYQSMSVQEMADLVGYLEGLKKR